MEPAKSSFGIICLLGLLALGVTSSVRAADSRSPVQMRQDADRNYSEKSYALALDDYRRLLPLLPKTSSDRTVIEYRIAVSLGQSQHWDDALTAIDQFLADHKREPVWQARGLYQRGLLLNLAPQQGYKVGTIIYRGTDYPHVTGSERPQYVNLQDDDEKSAVTDFEQALSDYEALPPAARPAVMSEEADLMFDLAKLLPLAQTWGSDDDWKAAKTTNWRIDPMKPYDSSWPSPKKVLFLYARIPTLNIDDTHRIVLAAVGEALYIAQWSGEWKRSDDKQADGTDNPQQPELGVVKPAQTLPYYFLNDLAILEDAAAKYPSDPQAPQLRMIVAKWMGNRNDYASALKQYNIILTKYPYCHWIPDAQEAVRAILSKSLWLSTPGMQSVDKNAVITINSKNIRYLYFRAYSAPLRTILNDPKVANDTRTNMESYEPTIGGPYNTSKLGPIVAEWSAHTLDKGDYVAVKETVPTPLTKIGAYIVEVDGDNGTVHDAALVIISDLVVLEKHDQDHVLTFVTEAHTGQPVPAANVLVRQVYEWAGRDEHEPAFLVDVSRGSCDAQGIFITPVQQHTGYYLFRTEIFADALWQRYALAEESGSYPYNDDPNPEKIKGYVYTDRAVYRPGQSIYFRGIFAKPSGLGADYLPLAGRTFEVKITDGKGQSVFDKILTANQFGSIHDTLQLGKGASLGSYFVSVTYPISKEDAPLVNADKAQCGFVSFSVEEYKKPEFAVQVTPSATLAKFGDLVTAKIAARYYSGYAVANAAVSYRVFRSKSQDKFVFPQPFDWLYNERWYGLDNNGYGAFGELVTQGSARTDVHGNATLSFRPSKGVGNYTGDFSYTIVADVVDQSRRQITGEGGLRVVNQQFYAYLNLPLTFVQEGETMQIDLHTQNATRKPVSTTGVLTVFQLSFDRQTGKESSKAVSIQTVSTGSDGDAIASWSSRMGGQYRVSFTAHDQNNVAVMTTASFWVAGADLDPGSYTVNGIALFTDKTTYEEGQTARVFIVGQEADNWVLLMQEGDDRILHHDLIHIVGRAAVLNLPIEAFHVSGFTLTASTIRNYALFQASQDVSVPPTHKFIAVAVTGDKKEYYPGESATFHVKTSDFQGHPVASEVSLSVTDSSLDYIQPQYHEDIRSFYYSYRRRTSIDAHASVETEFSSIGDWGPSRLFVQTHGFVMPDMGRIFQGESSPAGYRSNYGMYRDVFSLTGKPTPFGDWNGRRVVIAGTVQFPGLTFGRPGVTPDPSGYTHIRGSDFNQVGFDVDGVAVTNASDNPFTANTISIGLKQAQVRSNFADTAFWTPAIVTDPVTGEATLNVTFPDTLTTWNASARGATQAMQVGTDKTHVVTTKHLLVRLESPRFFVERDQVTLSAIVMNTLTTTKQVRVSLDADAGLLDAADKIRTVTVAAGSEQRVDWTAHVKGAGTAKITMTAQTDEESDAVCQSFPVLEYGVQKFIAGGGVLGDSETRQTFTVTIPHGHKPGSAALLVQVTPSLAATAMDALPYLADYPYGCIEQTLSRFVPTVLVAGALREAGIDLDILHKRALMLQAQAAQPMPLGQTAETTDDTDQTGYTYPHGTPNVLKTPMLAPELQDPTGTKTLSSTRIAWQAWKQTVSVG